MVVLTIKRLFVVNDVDGNLRSICQWLMVSLRYHNVYPIQSRKECNVASLILSISGSLRDPMMVYERGATCLVGCHIGIYDASSADESAPDAATLNTTRHYEPLLNESLVLNGRLLKFLFFVAFDRCNVSNPLDCHCMHR